MANMTNQPGTSSGFRADQPGTSFTSVADQQQRSKSVTIRNICNGQDVIWIQCLSCNRKFVRCSTLLDHIKRGSAQLVCQQCGDSFTNNCYLTYHYFDWNHLKSKHSWLRKSDLNVHSNCRPPALKQECNGSVKQEVSSITISKKEVSLLKKDPAVLIKNDDSAMKKDPITFVKNETNNNKPLVNTPNEQCIAPSSHVPRKL